MFSHDFIVQTFTQLYLNTYYTVYIYLLRSYNLCPFKSTFPTDLQILHSYRLPIFPTYSTATICFMWNLLQTVHVIIHATLNLVYTKTTTFLWQLDPLEQAYLELPFNPLLAFATSELPTYSPQSCIFIPSSVSKSDALSSFTHLIFIFHLIMKAYDMHMFTCKACVLTYNQYLGAKSNNPFVTAYYS